MTNISRLPWICQVGSTKKMIDLKPRFHENGILSSGQNNPYRQNGCFLSKFFSIEEGIGLDLPSFVFQSTWLISNLVKKPNLT